MRTCLILAVVAFLAIPYAYGQDEGESGKDGLISQILDTAKPCLLLDIKEARLLGGVTASVIDYKGYVSLDIGGMTDLNSNALLIGISGNVQTLAERYGLSFNLPEKVSVGSFLARDFTEKEFIYGLSLAYKIDW